MKKLTFKEFEMDPVISSQIVSIGHVDATLAVEFKGGTVYIYDGVTEAVFNELLVADSVGRAFNGLVKSAGIPFVKLPKGLCILEEVAHESE